MNIEPSNPIWDIVLASLNCSGMMSSNMSSPVLCMRDKRMRVLMPREVDMGHGQFPDRL